MATQKQFIFGPILFIQDRDFRRGVSSVDTYYDHGNARNDGNKYMELDFVKPSLGRGRVHQQSADARARVSASHSYLNLNAMRSWMRRNGKHHLHYKMRTCDKFHEKSVRLFVEEWNAYETSCDRRARRRSRRRRRRWQTRHVATAHLKFTLKIEIH